MKFKKQKFQSKITKKPRDAWEIAGIEFLRFILIFLIMWTEFRNPDHSKNIITFDIAVPCFLILTGYCFVSKKTIFKNLFASSIIYMVVGVILYTVLYNVSPHHMSPVVDFEIPYKIWDPLKIITEFNFIKDHYSTWWFLFVLLILFLFCPLINKLLVRYNQWLTLGAIFFLYLITYAYEVEIGAGKTDRLFSLFTIGDVLLAISLYAVGGWFSHNFRDKLNNLKAYYTVPVYLLIIGGWIVMCVYNKQICPIVDGKKTNFAVDTTQFTSIPSVLASIALVQLFQMIKFKENNRIHEHLHKQSMWLGETVLLIYLFHGLVYEFIKLNPTLLNLGGSDGLTLEKFFVVTSITFVGCLLTFPFYIWSAKQIEKGFDWIGNKVKLSNGIR